MSRTATTHPLNTSADHQALVSEPNPTRNRRKVPSSSKIDLVLKKLRSAKGTTLGQLAVLTGWQQHSVRGFLSGTVRKKRGLNLVSEVGKDGIRRYRVIGVDVGAAS